MLILRRHALRHAITPPPTTAYTLRGHMLYARFMPYALPPRRHVDMLIALL